jgi:ribonuclease Z
LTHLHADHILGIPGLLETMAFQGRTAPITIAGPVRTAGLMRTFATLGCCSRSFDVSALELEPGDKIRMNGFDIIALKTRHSVPSLGYCLKEDERPGRFNRERAIELGVPVGPCFGRLQKGNSISLNGITIHPFQVMGSPRPGRKIVYSGDTRPCPEVEAASKDADLLIHDCAMADDLLSWAEQTLHSTAGEAAALAARAGARKLALTHISSRYSEDVRPLLADAKKHLDDVTVAEDLMKIDIPLRE